MASERVQRRLTAIVAADERETKGERALLNFGHTVGHAIERAGEYRAFLHGEAVAVGMQGAAAISVRKGLLAPEIAALQQRVLERFALPLRWPG